MDFIDLARMKLHFVRVRVYERQLGSQKLWLWFMRDGSDQKIRVSVYVRDGLDQKFRLGFMRDAWIKKT
jgi:hypothetical protein